MGIAAEFNGARLHQKAFEDHYCWADKFRSFLVDFIIIITEAAPEPKKATHIE